MSRRLLRRLYAQYFRERLRRALFDSGRVSVLTRERVQSSPPSYVDEIWTYGKSETVQLPVPTAVCEVTEDIQQKVGTWCIDAPFVARCEDIQLVGPDALPISSDNSFLEEGVDGSTKRATDAVVRSLLDRKVPRRRATDSEYEIAVSLAGPWSDQFFHWFVEYLPRVLAVEAYGEHSSMEPVYLIPSDPPDWLTRSLELFEIPDERIRPWSGSRTNVRVLLLPSLWRHTESTAPLEGYVHSPRGIREVSDQLRKTTPEGSARDDVSTRLYVSRSSAPTRDVVNESELQPVFEEYGFDVIHPETWSLDEQVATFATADVVAGPHGGGLTNAMYASDPTVLEIFGADTNPCYYALFTGCGWDYGLVQGNAVGEDIRIEPDKFRQLCEQMID